MPKPTAAEWAARIEVAQERTHVHLCGIPYARKSYGSDHPEGDATCRDCGVQRGLLHVPGCCMERCPICAEQAMCCGCADDEVAA